MKVELWTKRIVGIICGICVLFILVVSSFDIAIYSDYGYFQREYEKYDVNNENGIVNVKMDNLMYVTREMLSYLRGKRDNLDIKTTIDGTEKEFFNNIEKYHMADVKNLFIKGLEIRKRSVIIVILGIVGLACAFGFRSAIRTILLYTKKVLFVAMALLAVVLGAVFTDFTKAFYIMHYMLFDNTLWIMDGGISRLVNILPEGFFVDIATRIGIIYIAFNIIILILAYFVGKKKKIRRYL